MEGQLPLAPHYRGLADVLEPSAPSPRGSDPVWGGPGLPEFPVERRAAEPEAAAGAMPRPAGLRAPKSRPRADVPMPVVQLSSVSLVSVPIPSAVPPSLQTLPSGLPIEAREDPPAPARRRPWVWIGLGALLAAGSSGVLYAKTDLFRRDIVLHRDVETDADNEGMPAPDRLAAIETGGDVERASIRIDSAPPGARVWWVEDGPVATFADLPVDHQYMVVVFAAGHVPRVRQIRGRDLVAPLVINLDVLDDSDVEVEFPTVPAPDRVEPPGPEVATLTLRSHTPQARFGLMIGDTPHAEFAHVDPSRSYRFRLTLEGYADEDLVIDPDDWPDDWPDDPEGALVQSERVELRPRRPAEVAGSSSELGARGG